jgi:hypothetical protein
MVVMPGGSARNTRHGARWIAGYLASFLISQSVMPSAPRNFRPRRVEGSTKKVREKIYELQQL